MTKSDRNRVSLGSLALSGWFGKISPDESRKLVYSFIKMGGYYIDTAPLYGFGLIEEMIGKSLKTIARQNYFLITKCGFSNLETCQSIAQAKKFHKDLSYAAVIKDCESSLKRLNTDYIDLYCIHTRDLNTPISETARALAELKARGKIIQIGICNSTLEEVIELKKYVSVNYIQNRFSLVNRSLDRRYEQYLLKNGIYLTPYRVIEAGLLAQYGDDRVTLATTDIRVQKPDWQEVPRMVLSQWFTRKLSPIANDLGVSPAQLCIAWSLNQPVVKFAIVGATTSAQLINNLYASEIKLDKQIKNRVEKVYQDLVQQVRREYNQSLRVFRGLNFRYY